MIVYNFISVNVQFARRFLTARKVFAGVHVDCFCRAYMWAQVVSWRH